MFSLWATPKGSSGAVRGLWQMVLGQPQVWQRGIGLMSSWRTRPNRISVKQAAEAGSQSDHLAQPSLVLTSAQILKALEEIEPQVRRSASQASFKRLTGRVVRN